MSRRQGHSRHLTFVLAIVGLFAAVAVAGASAADFEADGGPCPETKGEAALLRCPTGYVGVPYSVQIESEEGSGCSPDYDWFEIVNSSLPPGLSMNRDGLITGIPTSAGFTRFWVFNHDTPASEGGPSWCIRDDVSEREFSIPIDPGLAIANESLKPATIGQPYAETLTAKQITTLNPPTGSDVQASWSLQSGSLPPGLVLSESGALTGTPTAEGSYQFAVRAFTGSPSVTKTFTLSSRQPLVVTSPFAPTPRRTAEVGIRFGKSASATGGSGTYAWSLASGTLPAGLTLNTSSGAISGTPQAAGSSVFVLAVSDTEGRVTTTPSSIAVAAKLTMRTRKLKSGKVGRAYVARLATSGGVRPLKWKLSGKLPAGLRFAKTGTIAGKPRKAGSFRVTASATDALGAKIKRALTLTVAA